MRKLLTKLWLFCPALSQIPPQPLNFCPGIEVLEDRLCPAGFWTWNGPVNGGLWSNAVGTNWLLNGNAVAANQYPGMPDPSTMWLNLATSLQGIVRWTSPSIPSSTSA